MTKRRPLEKSVAIFQTAINKYFSFLECPYQNLIAYAFLKKNIHHVFLNLDFNTQHFTLLCSLQLINKDRTTTSKTSIKTRNRCRIQNKMGHAWVFSFLTWYFLQLWREKEKFCKLFCNCWAFVLRQTGNSKGGTKAVVLQTCHSSCWYRKRLKTGARRTTTTTQRRWRCSERSCTAVRALNHLHLAGEQEQHPQHAANPASSHCCRAQTGSD